ncbi:MAG: tetratricopeptide repeat protein [Oscillatoriales cyanobacterium RM1_1_9]|nr:tetratricopeptide repeat protein [Oscillatoriales cyanobacterium SM2_3_0]NJO45354.1 tetratricopeptide repeat protein [Oscillatoriales cyanobacterium RM2_1_1]NJO70741.1 tetratricopeptide repeat protein [Oscillatoriales cyanobacterium RM1_1_9]
MEPTTSVQSDLAALYQTGQAQLHQGQFLPALKVFQKLLTLAQTREHSDDITALQVDGLIEIGKIHRHLQHFAWSIKCFERALSVIGPADNSLKQGGIHQEIGQVYWISRQYSPALRAYVKALEIFQHHSDLEGICSVLNHLGEVYNAIGLFDQALRSCQKALMILKTLEQMPEPCPRLSPDQKALILYNLGVTQAQTRRYPQALAYLSQALAIQQQLHRHGQSPETSPNQVSTQKLALQSADTLKQMGTVYLFQGKHYPAFEAYQKAERIYRTTGQLEPHAEVLDYLGIICYRRGNKSQALWYHLKALEQFKTLENWINQPEKLPHILTVYRQFNLSNEGVRLYRRSQELIEILGSEVG